MSKNPAPNKSTTSDFSVAQSQTTPPSPPGEGGGGERLQVGGERPLVGEERLQLAFLISSHTDAAHLARLVRALDGLGDFYVHVDASADDAPMRAALGGRVHFVERYRVSWGGWSQVEYQISLLRAALASGRRYTHLVALSGLDYPLWSDERIRQFFAQHIHDEIICGYNLTRGTSDYQRTKFTHYHPFRDLAWRSRWWKNKVIVLARNVLKYSPFRRAPQVVIDGAPRDIYFGSDWWALTPRCAAHIVRTLDTEPAVARYFRTTFAPSELCIQTIVFNSPFADRALLSEETEYPGLARLTPLHYIDYGAQIKQLTFDDLPVLTEHDKMFCRKIVTGTSDRLADEIDKRRGKRT